MKQQSKASRRSVSIAGKRALQTAVITGCLMFAFELTKMTFSPRLGIWGSHSLTILFVTVMAGLISLAVLKQDARLRLEMATSEERYRLLFERSLAGAYRTSLEDGRILDCNVSFCRMFGYESREEVIGNSVEIGYPNPADRAKFLDKLRTEKIVSNFEQRLRRKDGRIVWVLNSATLLTRDDGTGAVIRGTLTDITDLRNSELQNRRLAAIIRCTDENIPPVFHEPRNPCNSSRNQDPAVDSFYSAADRRSRGDLWPILAPAPTVLCCAAPMISAEKLQAAPR